MGKLVDLRVGALTLLKTVTLGADAPLLTIPAIPGGYADLVLFAALRGTMAAAGANCHIQFNGDVAANYDHQYLLGGNVSFSAAAANNAYGLIGTMPAANAVAASIGIIKGEIIGYAMLDRNKEMLSESHWRGAIATDQSRLKAGVQWLSLAPISQIDLFAQTLNLKAGSTAWLYGRSGDPPGPLFDESEITPIYAGGAEGLWYAPYDFSTLYQDRAGTTQVTAAGQSVGKMLDKSGRGHHATAPTDAARPVIRVDANARWYLDFDGVDDRMDIAGVLDATTSTMVVACTRENPMASFRTCLKINKQALMSNFDVSNNWGGYNNANLLSGWDAGPRGIWTMVTRAANDVDLRTDNALTHSSVTRATGISFNSYTPQLGADVAGTQFSDMAFFGGVVTLAAESAATLLNIREYLSIVSNVAIA